MESLGKIFGSSHRVKIMRLFLFHELEAFDIGDVSDRSLVKRPDARKELTMLTKIGFLKKKSFTKKIPKKASKAEPNPGFKRVAAQGWILNKKFELAVPLQSLLIDSELVKEKSLIKKLKKAGSIKLLALSGIFLRDENRNIDMLIVGDSLKREVLEKEIVTLESEIGRELSYAVFETKEFNYRITMYDKLIRDVLENKHSLIINKIKK